MSVAVPVSNIVRHFDPLADPPWGCAQITKQEVLAWASDEGKVPFSVRFVGQNWSREHHIARIAFLVRTGWDRPIEIDVGVPSLGCHIPWPIIDGNHRLAAAAIRGDATIEVSVGGDLALAEDLFGVDCCEQQRRAPSSPANTA